MAKSLLLIIFILFQLTTAQGLIAKEKVSHADLLKAIKKHERDNPSKDYYYLAGLENIVAGMYKDQVITVLETVKQKWSAPNDNLIIVHRPINQLTSEPLEVILGVWFEGNIVDFKTTRYLKPKKVKLDLE